MKRREFIRLLACWPGPAHGRLVAAAFRERKDLVQVRQLCIGDRRSIGLDRWFLSELEKRSGGIVKCGAIGLHP